MRTTGIRTAARRFAVRMWRDHGGAAGIEFGLLAPLLMLMLLGTIEGGRAVNMDRHFNAAAATVGDLVAREESLGTTTDGAKANLDAMMGSIAQVLAPYDADDLSLSVISVQASPTNASETKVVWSYSYKNRMPVPNKCQAYSLPANLVPKGGSVIVVDAKYKFTPLFADYVPGFGSLTEFKDKSYHNPRNSCVDYVKGNNCTNSC